MRRLAKPIAAVLAFHVGVAAAADDLFVDIDRKGRSFAIRAHATVAAPVATVWEAVTDYDNLARFIPGMSRSAVQLRAGNRVVVEQKGEARFLVFSYPIEVLLEVQESPSHSVMSRRVGGNLRRMSGRYDLERARGGIRLRYSGELEPDFASPRHRHARRAHYGRKAVRGDGGRDRAPGFPRTMTRNRWSFFCALS